MTKIYKYVVQVKGATPLLQNRLSKDLIDEIKKVPRDKREEWQDQNFMKKLYLDADGKTVIFPTTNIHSFLVSCARKNKIPPPKSIGKTWTDYIKSAVYVDENCIIKHNGIAPFESMVNGNPSSMKKSSKVYCVRPKMDNWSATFSFTDFGGYLDDKAVESLMNTGKLFIGLGDYRPVYGRFSIEKITSKLVGENDE